MPAGQMMRKEVDDVPSEPDVLDVLVLGVWGHEKKFSCRFWAACQFLPISADFFIFSTPLFRFTDVHQVH